MLSALVKLSYYSSQKGSSCHVYSFSYSYIAIHPEGKGRRPDSVQLNRMLVEQDPDEEVRVGLEVTIANGAGHNTEGSGGTRPVDRIYLARHWVAATGGALPIWYEWKNANSQQDGDRVPVICLFAVSIHHREVLY